MPLLMATAVDLFKRLLFRRPVGVVEGTSLNSSAIVSVDICIVTNCGFVGGNASSTVAEFRALADAGYKTVIVHCPIRRSRWKRHWIAEKFLPFQSEIIPAHALERLACSTLIVRGPRMVMTSNFESLARKLTAKDSLYIVNNSAWNENGKPLFDWNLFFERIQKLNLGRSRVGPISPLIRNEGSKVVALEYSHLWSEADWPPAFDVREFEPKIRPSLTAPIVIGRHGRDHEGKWLEDAEELRMAYPDRSDVIVSIMGGAEIPRKILGTLPGNWRVSPFGSKGVSDYLATLDVFVNFPARTRDEAFGRTIIEAILAGLPVILPPTFEQTFGDLAIYCEPVDVERIITRLADNDEERIEYISRCREEAEERFGTKSLLRRLEDRSQQALPCLDDRSKRFRALLMSKPF